MSENPGSREKLVPNADSDDSEDYTPRGKKRRIKSRSTGRLGAEDADDEHSRTTVDPGDPEEDVFAAFIVFPGERSENCSVEGVFATNDVDTSQSDEITMDCSMEVFVLDSGDTGQYDDSGGLSTDCSNDCSLPSNLDTGQFKDAGDSNELT